MNELIQIDHYLFHLLNEEWTNGLFDMIMPYWRDKMTWIPLYLFAIGFFIYKFKKQAVYIILGTLLCFGTADTISHKVIKKSVVNPKILNNYQKSKYWNFTLSCISKQTREEI